MFVQLFTVPAIVGIITSGIRLATPYLFASLGEMFAQRSGVDNLGTEGIMLMGAFSAYYVVLKSGNLALGLLIACIVGAIMGLAMAFISVTLHAEQGISGIGVYLFGLGMSDLLFQAFIGTPIPITGFPDLHIPLLSQIPVIGGIFFQQNILMQLIK